MARQLQGRQRGRMAYLRKQRTGEHEQETAQLLFPWSE